MKNKIKLVKAKSRRNCEKRRSVCRKNTVEFNLFKLLFNINPIKDDKH